MSRAKVLKSMALRRTERDIERLARAHWISQQPPCEPSINWVHVYQLVDPRDGVAFYVGKGGPHRLVEHQREAERGALTAKCVRIREICAEYCHTLPEQERKWYGDQLAVAHVVRSGKFKVLTLPCDIFNYTPRTELDDLSDRAIVHYKGKRKEWLLK